MEYPLEANWIREGTWLVSIRCYPGVVGSDAFRGGHPGSDFLLRLDKRPSAPVPVTTPTRPGTRLKVKARGYAARGTRRAASGSRVPFRGKLPRCDRVSDRNYRGFETGSGLSEKSLRMLPLQSKAALRRYLSCS